jgi:hypothetical protein
VRGRKLWRGGQRGKLSGEGDPLGLKDAAEVERRRAALRTGSIRDVVAFALMRSAIVIAFDGPALDSGPVEDPQDVLLVLVPAAALAPRLGEDDLDPPPNGTCDLMGETPKPAVPIDFRPPDAVDDRLLMVSGEEDVESGEGPPETCRMFGKMAAASRSGRFNLALATASRSMCGFRPIAHAAGEPAFGRLLGANDTASRGERLSESDRVRGTTAHLIMQTTRCASKQEKNRELAACDEGYGEMHGSSRMRPKQK